MDFRLRGSRQRPDRGQRHRGSLSGYSGYFNADGNTDVAAVDSSGAARPLAARRRPSLPTGALTVLSPVAGTAPALLNEGVYTF
jgi:hypothetical protein